MSTQTKKDSFSEINSYRELLDGQRFEEQIINGISGYYDKIEKVFLDENIFKILYDTIKPEKNFQISDNDIIKSKKRVQNIIAEKNSKGKDSYSQIFTRYLSNRFLLQHKNETKKMCIFYIDLVGSTSLTAILSSVQLSKIIKLFFQEVSIFLSKNNGYVLKYAGDAVIGYFPGVQDIKNACNDAVRCAKSIQKIIDSSINEILYDNGYPKIRTRISIDSGENQIVVLGSEPDLLGHIISRAAKIMSVANHNQIVIGNNVFMNLDENLQDNFKKQDKFMLHETGECYSVHLS